MRTFCQYWQRHHCTHFKWENQMKREKKTTNAHTKYALWTNLYRKLWFWKSLLVGNWIVLLIMNWMELSNDTPPRCIVQNANRYAFTLKKTKTNGYNWKCVELRTRIRINWTVYEWKLNCVISQEKWHDFWL